MTELIERARSGEETAFEDAEAGVKQFVFVSVSGNCDGRDNPFVATKQRIK